MALASHLKCTCDKCNREQIFDSWDAAKASAWRDVHIDVIGGSDLMSPSRRDAAPRSLRALLCGDCVGGLGIKAAPAPELVEA